LFLIWSKLSELRLSHRDLYAHFALPNVWQCTLWLCVHMFRCLQCSVQLPGATLTSVLPTNHRGASSVLLCSDWSNRWRWRRWRRIAMCWSRHLLTRGAVIKRSMTGFTPHGVRWVFFLMEYELIYLEPTACFLYSMSKMSHTGFQLYPKSI
jgi:hypothetical protein